MWFSCGIWWCERSEYSSSWFSNIVSSMCLRLQDFRSVQVLHIKQLGNKLMHILAQYARDLESYATWIEENLVFLKFALAYDALNLSSYSSFHYIYIYMMKMMAIWLNAITIDDNLDLNLHSFICWWWWDKRKKWCVQTH